MRRISLAMASVVVMITLAGCTTSEVSDPSSSQSVHTVKSAEPTMAEKLDELSMKSFSIPGDKLREEDADSVAAFGKAFVNLYTGALAEQQKVKFDRYITNSNLLAFVSKMLELEQKQETRGGIGVNFGFENVFKEAQFKLLDETHASLALQFSYEGSGMTCKLLVEARDKSLHLVDVYFGNKDGVDTQVTGHPAVRKVDNPKLWEDEEWVNGVMKKLDNYESAKKQDK